MSFNGKPETVFLAGRFYLRHTLADAPPVLLFDTREAARAAIRARGGSTVRKDYRHILTPVRVKVTMETI